jgi:hypothetical protein
MLYSLITESVINLWKKEKITEFEVLTMIQIKQLCNITELFQMLIIK